MPLREQGEYVQLHFLMFSTVLSQAMAVPHTLNCYDSTADAGGNANAECRHRGIDAGSCSWYIQLMLKYLILALLVVSSSVAAADVDYAVIDPVVEMRGIWIDAGAIPRTEDGIRDLVRSYARANFNVLLPEVICRGYAVYPSAHIARDPRFAGAIDPLPIMISEAHRHGMEVHPWVWVFRAGYTKDKGAILTAHPEWAEMDAKGNTLSPNGGYWISPVVPAAREFLAGLYAELVTKYDVDGLHLDYIRYETEEKAPYGFSPTSRELFSRQYGLDPAEVQTGTLDQAFWNKFRERQINTFVQKIALQTRTLRPDVVISAAVAPYPPDARLLYMQNWPNWVANKWVDYVAPMSYSADDGYFGRLIYRQKEAVRNQTIITAGLGVMSHKDTDQTTRQIAESRRRGALGQVAFAASYVKDEHITTLAAGPYCRPAYLPFRDPNSARGMLFSCAADARGKGSGDLANYYESRAAILADYCSYRSRQAPYAPPTAPPFPASQ